MDCKHDLQRGRCQNTPIAASFDAVDYGTAHERAFGASTSLYEQPPGGRRSGEPVADCYGIVARRNHCVMALADGVNWGEKARTAAQCAIRGALEHVQAALQHDAPRHTQALFHALLGAFHAGHQLILQEHGQLTTLCVAVVCRLRASSCWVVCACNVGDSLCFVTSPGRGTREVTLGSHDISCMRDMRDAGGALGPVDGVNPELHNLTCSMTFVDEGDIVFITSDGVSDNFDPVVGKFCIIEPSPGIVPVTSTSDKENDTGRSTRHSPPGGRGGAQSDTEQPNPPSQLPVVTAHQRHELMLLRMDDLLERGANNQQRATSARQVVTALVDFVTQLTRAKRTFLEDPDLYREQTRPDQKRQRRAVRLRMSEMPGKLDHATVVAYTVGEWPDAQITQPSTPDSQRRRVGTNGDTTPDGGQSPASSSAPDTPVAQPLADGLIEMQQNEESSSEGNDSSLACIPSLADDLDALADGGEEQITARLADMTLTAFSPPDHLLMSESTHCVKMIDEASPTVVGQQQLATEEVCVTVCNHSVQLMITIPRSAIVLSQPRARHGRRAGTRVARRRVRADRDRVEAARLGRINRQAENRRRGGASGRAYRAAQSAADRRRLRGSHGRVGGRRRAFHCQ